MAEKYKKRNIGDQESLNWCGQSRNGGEKPWDLGQGLVKYDNKSDGLGGWEHSNNIK